METIEIKRIGEHYMEGGLYQDEQGRYYVDCHNSIISEDGFVDVYQLSPATDIDGEPCYPFKGKVINPPTDKENRVKAFKFEYMMLSRLNSDVDAYFNRPNDFRYHNEHVTGDIAQIITEIKALWQRFPDDLKPKWCTLEMIRSYEEALKKRI